MNMLQIILRLPTNLQVACRVTDAMEHSLSSFSKLVAGISLSVAALSSNASAQLSHQVDWTVHDPSLVGAIRTAEFSPRGRYVAYAAEFTRQVMIRRSSDGSLVTTLAGSANMGVSEAQFSPMSGQVAATWSITGWTLAVFGGAETFGPGSTGPLLTTTDHDSFVTSLAWSPNSLTLLTGSTEGIAALVDANTGLPILEVDHGVEIRDVAFSADGLLFATAGVDGAINIWDANSGALVRVLVAHLGAVSQIEFHDDNTHIATGGGLPQVDTQIHVFNYTNGTLVTSHTIQNEEVTGLEFIAGGTLLMSTDYSGILRISESFGPNEVTTIDAGRGPRITSLDVHEGRGKYVYGTGDGWVTMASR